MATLPTASLPADSSDPLKLALFLQNPAEPLSPLQLRVAAALARGLSVTSAAAEAGVHRTTIHHWLRCSEEFEAAVRAARAEASARCRAELHELAALALKTLRTLLESPAIPPAVRLRAALAALRGDLLPNPAFIEDWPLPSPPARLPISQDPLPGPPSIPQPAESTPPSQCHVPAPPAPAQPAPPPLSACLLPGPAPAQAAPPPAPVHTPRSAPCPCGSGRKFKRCCGSDAPPVLTSR
jgi:AcrR family transcriptional regulator